MLRRKIEKDIINWLKNDYKALLIDGARQVGKTYIIKEFGYVLVRRKKLRALILLNMVL